MADAASVEDLRSGDHACLTFSDTEERLDLVAAFIRDGLRLDHKVLCVTDSLAPDTLVSRLTRRGLPVDEARDAGQLVVTTAADTFLTAGSFSASTMIDMLTAEINQALDDGHRGLRITSDMCWALRPVAGLDELMPFESRFTALLAQGNATAVCQYDRQSFDTLSLAGVAATHSLTVAAVTYHDDAMLRICRQYMPAGLRVAGEIDYRAMEPLTRALSEALALDDHVHINLDHLSFIDAVAGGAFIQAAQSLSDEQTMIVRCQPLVHKVLHLLGANTISGLTVVVSDDD